MDLSHLEVPSILAALPERFRFYHLGEVEREEATPQNAPKGDFNEDPSTRIAEPGSALTFVAFRIYDDLTATERDDGEATLLISFDSELDVSIYSELGNILSSRLATEAWKSPQPRGIMVSPPKVLSAERAGLLLHSGKLVLRSRYIHRAESGSVPVEIYVMIHRQPNEVGHA